MCTYPRIRAVQELIVLQKTTLLGPPLFPPEFVGVRKAPELLLKGSEVAAPIVGKASDQGVCDPNAVLVAEGRLPQQAFRLGGTEKGKRREVLGRSGGKNLGKAT